MSNEKIDYAALWLLETVIACGIDHPSVYMGGPSANSRKKAKLIVGSIIEDFDLSPTEEGQNRIATVKTWLNPDGTRKDD